MKKSALKFSLAVFVCVSLSSLADTVYSFQTAFFPGDTFTQLLGINNFGTIAGYNGSGATGHPNKGFLLTLPHQFTDYNFPGSVQTQVVGINSRRDPAGVDTVGFYIDTKGVTHGFRAHGLFFRSVDFPDPTSVLTQLLGLNDLGLDVGYWQNAAGTQFPFTKSGAIFTPLNPLLPANTSAQATGVNNAGDVSGFYVDAAGVNHGFLLHKGVVTRLDFPGATFTQALGLNNRQQVVGFYMDVAGNSHGFLYDAKELEYQSVNIPRGVDSTTINGINDVGQIVGFFVDPITGNTNGFVGRIARCVEN